MSHSRSQRGFTLVELLVTISIISLLATILAPGLAAARAMARSANCLANLKGLGATMATYHAANRESFWRCTMPDHPEPGVTTYFWGTNTDPVDADASPFMKFCDGNLALLWCPSMDWGSYVPQGNVSEPTTTYGYNSWCLDPASFVWDFTRSPKKVLALSRPADLFVFADAAMAWSPGGVSIFQNSTHLEPVTGPWMSQPTTHFRHRGKTNALCADGHSAAFDLQGGTMADTRHQLGFVGESNVPHYDEPDDDADD